jgi:outer membrane immunogenic protein
LAGAPRLGLAWDRVLFYAKGGAAWVNDDYSLSVAPGVPGGLAGVTTVTADKTRWGWMVGVGVEYAFAQNWSVKVEYNYMDFGTERVLLTSNGAIPGQLPFEEDISRKIQVVKVGVNYKFDWGGPLVARY